MDQTALDYSVALSTLPLALQTRGWWYSDNFLSSTLVDALLGELQMLEEPQALSPAGVGRGQDFQVNQAIRRDHTHWLDGQSLAQCQFLGKIEQLRLLINQTLFMGLFDFEGHYSIYPSHGFYQKHLDSFAGQGNRVLSVVVYLNQDWLPGDGGELVLYEPEVETPVEFLRPIAGRVVIFLSEEIPHEVLPTRVTRRSIAGWYRVNNSLGGQVDPAQ